MSTGTWTRSSTSPSSEQFKDVPVRTYSSGMYMRLGFSVAMHIQPDMLLLDEVLAVGDEAFQHEVLRPDRGLQACGRDDRLRLARSERGRAPLRPRDHARARPRSRRRARRAEVVRAYHRRLVTGRQRPPRDSDGGSADLLPRSRSARRRRGRERARPLYGGRADGARGLAVLGATRSMDANVTVGIRDADGRPIGSQTLEGVLLRPGASRAASAQLPRAADARGAVLRRRRRHERATATPSSPWPSALSS